MGNELGRLQAQLSESIQALQSVEKLQDKVMQLVDKAEETIRSGGVIYSFGNGGSACEAMHLTEELVARYLRERPGIRAVHLMDPCTITCWSNDYEFDGVFSRQVETFVGENDLVIAFSTSGNSQNIVRGMEAARSKNACTVLFGGNDGGKAAALADLTLIVDHFGISARIQEAHMFMVHAFVDLLEVRLYPECD